MLVKEEIQTFAAFQGKVSGNTIMGVSLIQEGPALGHGVFVDKRSLNKFKSLAIEKGRVKAKLNHFSSVEDTVGYYDAFLARACGSLRRLFVGCGPSGRWVSEIVTKLVTTGKDRLC
jgi:hypothetical protein